MSGPTTPPPTGTSPRYHRHSVDGLSARSKDQQQRFAHDIEWKVLGPMPTGLFLNEFFPGPPDPEVGFKEFGIDPTEINFASVPDSPKNEEDMYTGLVSTKSSTCSSPN